MLRFEVKFYCWCLRLSFKCNFNTKVNVNLQGHYINLRANFQVW